MLIDKHLMLLSHGFQLLLMKQQSHTDRIHGRLLGIDSEKVRPDTSHCQGKHL